MVDSADRRRYHSIERSHIYSIENLDRTIDFLDEVRLIQFSKEPIPSVTPLPQPTNVLPVNQPFTLVTTKDRLYKEAIGKGYPRYDEDFFVEISIDKRCRGKHLVKLLIISSVIIVIMTFRCHTF